jgi:NAD(P)-dependent dehydrogenase (short-subunit alcohol dehydrogenase family)
MLQGKTILVTGASGTLGEAVCSKAEESGACVQRLDLRFSKEGPDRHTVDLTDLDATRACFDSLGPFDVLLNLAGGFAMGANTWDEDDAQWDLMFKLNVATLRNALKAAVPHLLQSKGAIVNVGAYGAREGQGLMSAYCASKSVVMRLTESLANELREEGVNVNAVLPTVIDTPPNRADLPDVDPTSWVAPADLASVICFLASDSARAVHGALLPVRGLS